MENLQELIDYLSGLRGKPRNEKIEVTLNELEQDLPEWSANNTDKEIEHIIAERRIAALLVLVCQDEYKERVTRIAKAFCDGNYWNYA